jgi:hypothetical protein
MTTPEDQPHDPYALRAKAEHYRQLASGILDPKAIEALLELADEYDALAAELEARNAGQSQRPRMPPLRE